MSSKALRLAMAAECRPGMAKLVLLCLADHYSDAKALAWPSHARMATICGISLDTCQRAVRTLVGLGFVAIDTTAGRHNGYRLDLGAMAGAALVLDQPQIAASDQPQPAASRNQRPAADSGQPQRAASRKRRPHQPQPAATPAATSGHTSRNQRPKLLRNESNNLEMNLGEGAREDLPAPAEPAAPPPPKRAKRLPPDWTPDPFAEGSTAAAIVADWTDAQWAAEWELFTAYWTGEGGAKAAKMDWNATWRTWVLRSRTRGSPLQRDRGYAGAAARLAAEYAAATH